MDFFNWSKLYNHKLLCFEQWSSSFPGAWLCWFLPLSPLFSTDAGGLTPVRRCEDRGSMLLHKHFNELCHLFVSEGQNRPEGGKGEVSTTIVKRFVISLVFLLFRLMCSHRLIAVRKTQMLHPHRMLWVCRFLSQRLIRCPMFMTHCSMLPSIKHWILKPWTDLYYK